MKRGLLALSDRAGSSLGSLLLVMLVATNSSAADFGRFTLLMAFSIAAQSSYRAVPGSWLIVTKSRSDTQPSPPTAALYVALIASVAAVTLILSAGLLAGVHMAMASAVAAHCTAAIVTDTLRMAAYGAGNSRRPAVLTMISVGTYISMVALWLYSGVPRFSFVPVALYAVSIALAGLILAFMRPIRNSISVRRYFSENRHDLRGQIFSAAASSGSLIILPSLLQLLTGPAVVGAIRGAASLAGIPGQIPTALQPLLLTDTARKSFRGDRTDGNVIRWTLMVSALFLPAILIAILIPNSIGVKFFSESWTGIDQALVGILVSTWAGSCTLAVEAIYRVRGRMRLFGGIRAAGLLLVCLCAMTGAAIASAPGAAWGLALANGTILLSAFLARPKDLITQSPSGALT